MSDNADDPGLTSSKQFNFIRKIGRGGFAEVILVERKTDKKQFVVKKVDLEYVADKGDRALKLAQQETTIKLRHRNIVNIFSSFIENKSELSLVMEFCEGGDLQNEIYAREGEYFSESEIINWSLQLTVTLKFLHDQHILHRDINPKNVFLSADKRLIKLGDFGIAKVMDKTGGFGTTRIGTPSYSSPEYCNGEPYTAKSEAWSLGVLIYNLAALKTPFNGKNEYLVYRAIMELTPRPLPAQFSRDLREFVDKLIRKEPEQRMSVVEAVTHPFLLSAITNLSAQSDVVTLKAGRDADQVSNYEKSDSSTASSMHYIKRLLKAARSGRLERVKYYINNKSANIEAKDDQFGRTALHFASANGQLEVVKWLIEAGADVKAKSNDNDSNDMPIHLAAYSGHVGVVEYFVNNFSELKSVRDGNGRSPLDVAKLGKQTKVENLFITRENVQVSNNERSGSSTAPSSNDIEGLLKASRAGLLDEVKNFVINKKVNIDSKGGYAGRTALHQASLLGNLEVVKWLVEAGADVKVKSNDSDGNEMPIHWAALSGKLSVVKFFIEEIDDAMAYWKNGKGEIPMHRAASNGKLDVVKYFINERKVNIDEKDEQKGRTVLHQASLLGNLEVVKWLVEAGADVKVKSNYSDDNEMPIHWAALMGKLEVVQYFVENFPDLKCVTNGKGETPKDKAISLNQRKVENFLSNLD